jgi:hypothetical protein
MSLPLNQSVLLESKTLRTSAITNFSDDRALEILDKAKAIIFAVWGGAGWATTAQMAEYFQVTESAVKELYRVNQAEFRDSETKTLDGKYLRDVRQIFCVSSRTPKARIFSPLGALRIAMLLTESKIAAQVRTIILDLVAAVLTITPQTPTPTLPLPEQRLHTLVQAMKTLAELTGGRLNPYTEQHFQDFVGNLLAEHSRKPSLAFKKTGWA